MAAIKGFAETLRRGGLEDAKNRLGVVRTIESQADRVDWLVQDPQFRSRPVFPGTDAIQVEFEREVQDCAETFYRVGRESIEAPRGSTTTPQGKVLTKYAILNSKDNRTISSLMADAEELAFKRFKDITRKYILGGLMGPSSTVSDEERYVFGALAWNPAQNLKRPDIVSFITARCLAGDVAFFARLGRKLRDSEGGLFNPFHKIDYAMARFWTHPLMPLWMMTDEAGSTALSAAVRGNVQKGAYEKVRKTLELPAFPTRGIREVKRFKTQELEYVYYGWVNAGSPKRGAT